MIILLQDQVCCPVEVITWGRHKHWTPNRKIKNLCRTLSQNVLQRNAGSVRLKDVQEGSERICEKMSVLHVIQRNVKEKTEDTLLIPVKCFLRLRMLINLHSSWFVLSKILCKCSAMYNIYFGDFLDFFYHWKYHSTNKSQENPFFPLSPFPFWEFFSFPFIFPQVW